ncbi:hypothetical protein CROQUDRAFT_88437 [Cronartium quercuum f. sp. fusiforme G11]|uniref:Reverse transcriptase zinc-binding domain-containing protein n=1 Tax=Cronartium quercuum f. sp. fusiforme G11 TaxID=708437 RepID=A0A9P6TF84_9BASI|nr:hypothetical protein CROQUDRAFT_88437 [Cronartium quercuum f. sp. fusiforme G11]
MKIVLFSRTVWPRNRPSKDFSGFLIRRHPGGSESMPPGKVPRVELVDPIIRSFRISNENNFLKAFYRSTSSTLPSYDPQIPPSEVFSDAAAQDTQACDVVMTLYLPLNEKADSEAKKAIEEDEDQVQLCISLSFLKAQTGNKFRIRRVPLNRPPYVTAGKKISDAFARLEKGQAAAIFQLRSGHSPLRHYLKRIQAAETAACPHCGITESTAHFLVYCKAYSKARRILWNRLRKDKIKTNYTNAAKLLDTPSAFKHLASFIEDTGRFQYPQELRCDG